jgi:hypothetical protein
MPSGLLRAAPLVERGAQEAGSLLGVEFCRSRQAWRDRGWV